MKKLLLIIILLFTITVMGFCKWYLPISHYDPDNQWADEVLIYDGLDNTAGSSIIGDAKTWSSFILLDVYSEIHCERIKYLAYQLGPTGIELIDIDLYYDSQWNDLYEGVFDSQVWTTIDVIPFQYLYSTRIRFYGKKADTALFYGLEFWNLGVDDLITMDFAFKGEPFVDLTGRSTIDLTKMDYSFGGQPFVSRVETEEEEAATNVLFTFSDF